MEKYKKLTDEQIVVEVRTKDKELYLEIVLRYQDKLLRYANSLSSDKNKSIDIVQNSFIKAFINLNSFNEKMKFSTWIYRIVHNELINELKKYKKEIRLDEEIEIESEENIELDFEKQEIKKEIENCLSELPILYKEIITLFFIEEKSYKEISDILRIPVGTVGIRINRAKILIKKICQINNQK
jgi:RNA polymerase sigma-70 factor (ECF subfamily)